MLQKLINFLFPVTVIEADDIYDRLYTSLKGWQNGKLKT